MPTLCLLSAVTVNNMLKIMQGNDKVRQKGGNLTELVQVLFSKRQLARLHKAQGRVHMTSRNEFIRSVCLKRVDEILAATEPTPTS